MSAQTLRVVARITALPDRVNEVEAMLLGLIAPTRQEAGCIKYELLHNQADPTDFTFVEEWECDRALDEHLASTHIAKAMARVPELLATLPDIRRYTLLA